MATRAGVAADALTQAPQINGGGAVALAWFINADAPVGAGAEIAFSPNTHIGERSYSWYQASCGARAKCLAPAARRTTSILGSRTVWGRARQRRRQHCLATAPDDENSYGGTPRPRRQHRLGQQHRVGQQRRQIVWGNLLAATTTTSCGATTRVGSSLLGMRWTTTTRLGNRLDDDNIVWAILTTTTSCGAILTTTTSLGNLYDATLSWATAMTTTSWGNGAAALTGKGGGAMATHMPPDPA